MSGWTENPNAAELLLGDNIDFVPIFPQSDPIGSVAPAGSVGSSLLQNLRVASEENRITQLLIRRAELTATAGLRFYDAMVDDVRSAFRRI